MSLDLPLIEHLGRLKIAVEDRFIIIQLNEESNLLPHSRTLESLVNLLKIYSKQYQILCDFRSVKHITNDLEEFLEEFSFINSSVLIHESQKHFFEEAIKKHAGIFAVNNTYTNFNEKDVNLLALAGDHVRDYYPKEVAQVEEYLINVFPGLPTKQEYKLFRQIAPLSIMPEFTNNEEGYKTFCRIVKYGTFRGFEIIYANRYLNDFIKRNATNSLLNEFTVSYDKKDEISIIPYHSNAYNLIKKDQQLLVGKPYIIANKTNAIFKHQLLQFKTLIENPKIKEHTLQLFFEENPSFFSCLGYKTIRPQIVLERDDGTSLIPDFFIQPEGDKWWDILDIKLPSVNIQNSGHRDRKKFSSAIVELQAQLREYGAYFENEKYAKAVERAYGIKCYKPKLIGIIGNNHSMSGEKDERQQRRMMTTYSDTQIVTFNKLYEIAKSRLLI